MGHVSISHTPLSTRSTVNTVNAERIDWPITGTIDWESQDRASMSYEMVIHMGSIAQMVANMGQGKRSTYMAIWYGHHRVVAWSSSWS